MAAVSSMASHRAPTNGTLLTRPDSNRPGVAAHFRDSIHSKKAEIELWPGLALVVQALKAAIIVLTYNLAIASIKRFEGWLATNSE